MEAVEYSLFCVSTGFIERTWNELNILDTFWNSFTIAERNEVKMKYENTFKFPSDETEETLTSYWSIANGYSLSYAKDVLRWNSSHQSWLKYSFRRTKRLHGGEIIQLIEIW